MLRPVKLNTSGDPWPRKSDKSRLYHLIVVDKIIAVCLVIGSLDPAPKLWKDHHLYVLVLKKNCLPDHILFGAADLIG